VSRRPRPGAIPRAWGVLLLIGALAFWSTAQAAETVPDGPPARSVLLGITFGARFFNEDLQLGNDFSFGGRVGIGLGSRWALMTDFVACHPSRETSGVITYVDALRFLARYNMMTGAIRPYVVAGVGGILFIFNDAPTTAGGALTVGLGTDLKVATRTRLFVEASRDIYSVQDITYDLAGKPLYTGDEHTRALGTISGGIGVEF
jgi:hypothetical protein